MENHPSAQFEDDSQFFLFLLAYRGIAMLSSSLSALGLCESIAGLSRGVDPRGQAGILGGGRGKEGSSVLGESNRKFLSAMLDVGIPCSLVSARRGVLSSPAGPAH